jgi:hypothetical protein
VTAKPHLEAALEQLRYERALLTLTIDTLEQLQEGRRQKPVFEVVQREMQLELEER